MAALGERLCGVLRESVLLSTSKPAEVWSEASRLVALDSQFDFRPSIFPSVAPATTVEFCRIGAAVLFQVAPDRACHAVKFLEDETHAYRSCRFRICWIGRGCLLRRPWARSDPGRQ